MKVKKVPVINLILIILTIVASVKVAVCGWIIDEGYAYAIGNRLLQGDLLFKDMWELHQTSGFAVEFFLWIYNSVAQTREGEILFVRVCGALIHLAVSVVLYFALKRHTSKQTAFLLAIIYANLTPKQLSTPEFSNLFNWSQTLVLICADYLLSSDRGKGDRKMTVLVSIFAGAFLSICVLSYPQSILFAAFVFALLLTGFKKEPLDFLIPLGVCLISGVLYLANILSYMSFSEFLTTIEKMIYVDSTHAEGVSKLAGYGRDAAGVVLFTAVFGLLSYFIGKIFKDKKSIVPVSLFLIFLWKFIHIAFKTDYYPMELTFGGILFVILIAAIYIAKNKAITGRQDGGFLLIYGGGSLAAFITVLIACDQSIYSSAKYLTVGLVAVLAVVLEEDESQKKAITLAAIIMVILVNIIQLNNPRNKLFNILDSGARVPYGPEKGLVLERMYANKARIDADELPGLLNGADYIMITGDAVTYLYSDARIGHGTTIMTEDYGIRFNSYWEMYPEKMPDIIAIECYDEVPNLDVWGSWLYEYAEGDFGAREVVDATYYRLYIR